MKRMSLLAIAVVCGWLMAGAAWGHFQVLLPNRDVIEADGGRQVDLSILFTHPMEQGPVMEMGKPRRFGMLVDGKQHDLLPQLAPKKIDGKSAYSASIRLSRPADYVFYLEPAPYWEPAEEKMIVHYTKVVVDYLGAEKGWDALVGLPVEIEPLVRPYGLWTGNVFRGVVRRDGKPVPFAEIEVEYYNEGRQVKPPSGAFVTQSIKADANGTFSYAIPRAGWWGFAALVDGSEKMKGPDGKMVDVELGGVMWVKTVDMK
jgi:cobalt/nickel transport protein